MKLASAAAFAWLAVAVWTPSPARAHAPAQATGIYWSEPGASAAQVWVRTNRGLIVGDETGTFRLLCGEALRASPSETPALLVSRNGPLVATFQGGLLSAAPDLCAFSPVVLPRAGLRVLDLGTTADRARIFALTAPTEVEPAVVLASEDGGLTWQAGASANAFGSSLRVAPSDSSRVYVAQQPLSDDALSRMELAVSEDGGRSFVTRPMPLNEDEVRAFVVGVGARDPDLLFVTTMHGNPLFEARLLVSRDAGRSFVTAFRGVGPLAVAEDARDSSIFVGSMDGVFRSLDGGASFTLLPERISNVGCMEVHRGALFVCGFAGNEFGVFRSADAGGTFSPYLRFTSVREGVSCAASTEVASACVGSIEHWKSELPVEEPSVPAPTPSDPEQPPPSNPEPRAASDACAVREGAPPQNAWLLPWLVLLAAIARRHRHTRTWERSKPSRVVSCPRRRDPALLS
jgi:MYXO-CTERM domain-containing protein